MFKHFYIRYSDFIGDLVSYANYFFFIENISRIKTKILMYLKLNSHRFIKACYFLYKTCLRYEKNLENSLTKIDEIKVLKARD